MSDSGYVKEDCRRVTKDELEARHAAAFIQGFVAAKGNRTPKFLHRHIRTSAQIFSGGAFNPLDVYAMVGVAKELWQAKVEGRKPNIENWLS